MEFSRQEYWSGLPFPSLGDLPNPGIELRSPTLQADTLPSEPQGKPYINHYIIPNLLCKYNLSHFQSYLNLLFQTRKYESKHNSRLLMFIPLVIAIAYLYLRVHENLNMKRTFKTSSVRCRIFIV